MAITTELTGASEDINATDTEAETKAAAETPDDDTDTTDAGDSAKRKPKVEKTVPDEYVTDREGLIKAVKARGGAAAAAV